MFYFADCEPFSALTEMSISGEILLRKHRWSPLKCFFLLLHSEIKQLIPCSFIYWSPIFHGWVNLAFSVYPQEPLFSSNIYWYSVREVINAPRGPIEADFDAAEHLHSSQAAANDDQTHHGQLIHDQHSLLMTVLYFNNHRRASSGASVLLGKVWICS